jgi:hypothetical protein
LCRCLGAEAAAVIEPALGVIRRSGVDGGPAGDQLIDATRDSLVRTWDSSVGFRVA